ncbi:MULTISPECIES: hypothetical protein [Prauserella salsuginis group]|uniref:Subtilisin inhibitor-like n=1 Tax=Prauserella salsuginis TaxID=387889 RepID=A0ABW6G7G1_9PSEU|nr:MULTISPECIES: hypothetical protein [Prauserella salsuginis group]MCR3719504.1 hypothetical protein [Prauserella flava]MCR3735482.1 hypothetical protein [Prauserella salsuginis]
MTRRSVRAAATLACAVAMGGLTAGTAAAAVPGAASPGAGTGEEPALVHANAVNECRLNVRTGPDPSASALTTLTCDNYTTCSNAGGAEPCGPYVTGGTYSCVGADGAQVTDNRWAQVAYRAPEAAYVAVACAEFREV